MMMGTGGDLERTHEVEQAYRQADHYARVAARLLYDGREADARAYAARYARAVAEAHQLHTLSASQAEDDKRDPP